MKTYCQVCGYPNDLGHLFCMKCGGKLDLSNIRDEIDGEHQSESVKGRLFIVGVVLIVIVVVLLVAALWPSKPFKREGATGGRRELAEGAMSRLQSMAETTREPYTNEPVREVDINAWLAMAAERAGAEPGPPWGLLNVQGIF